MVWISSIAVIASPITPKPVSSAARSTNALNCCRTASSAWGSRALDRSASACSRSLAKNGKAERIDRKTAKSGTIASKDV